MLASQSTHRILTPHSWLPKGSSWVTKHGHGYCTNCARKRQVLVMRIRAVADDVCDDCLKSFAVAENG